MSNQFTDERLEEVVVTPGAAISEMNAAEQHPRDHEEPAFPIEFLSVLQETGFFAIKEYLKKHGSPQELLDLVEDVEVLGIEMSRVELGKVPDYVNANLRDVVSSISCNIVKIGGIFFSPDGFTFPREAEI